MLEEIKETNFLKSLLESDIDTCKEIAKKCSPAELRVFVNKELGRSEFPTCIHIAAHKLISLDVWKFLCPLAENKNLYDGFNALHVILPDRDDILKELVLKQIPSGLSTQELLDILPNCRLGFKSTNERHVIQSSQLDKVRFWLEYTKNLQTKEVCKQRVDILCRLCRCKGSIEEGEALFQEILTLAQCIVTNYHIDINGTQDRCPVHWALENCNKRFLELFLFSGANANVLVSGMTPLNRMILLKGWAERLEICHLLIKHGANPFIQVPENGRTGVHSIFVTLQANELKSFFKNTAKYTEWILKKADTMPLPPVHGLIVFVKNQRMKSIQMSIIEKIKILLRFGLDLCLTDIHNRTILHYACWLRMNHLVRFLISQKMNPFDHDAFGRDCMYYAVTFPSADSLKVDDQVANMSTLKVLEKYLKQQLPDMLRDKTNFVEGSLDGTEKHSKTLETLKGVRFVEVLLKDSQIGPVRSTNLVKQVTKDIWALMNKLGERLAQREKAFEATIELAGSMSENTKVSPPDEFDFQFHLNTLSQYVECFACEGFYTNNAVQFCRNDTKKDLFDHILDKPGSMNLNISELFFATSYAILQERSFWDDLHFYWQFVHEYINRDSLVNPLVLKWVNPEGFDLEISVDLVPIIVQNKVPMGAELVIPEPARVFVEEMGLKWYNVCRHDTHARFSFFFIERMILKRLNQAVLEAYKLTKCILKYVGAAHCAEITSYMIKNALFKELDPDGSYNLLKTQIAFPVECSYLHSFVLREMRSTLRKKMQNEQKYIQSWACRIFDQLEKGFRSTDFIQVYFSPKVYLPEIAIITDEHGDDPYMKTFVNLKRLLKD